jgi:hypothetical protein
MGWQNVREYLLTVVPTANCQNRVDNQGSTDYGTFAASACLTRTMTGVERQFWTILAVNDAPLALKIFSRETAQTDSNWNAIQAANRTYWGGKR